ncbi:hypothetical protein AAFC00_001103 [Neodothiora populina]|uniref:HTH APSES-type domain-containing protein n=1 Tax=Neodothiora populina TaxID=2781224 RepID=A0ABR3PN33_9PEZI
MNGPSSYIDVSQSHMPQTIQSSAPPPGLSHYANYQTTQPMQGAPHPYGSSPTSYSGYGYSNGLAPLHPGHSSAPSVGPQMVAQQHPSLPTIANSVPPGSAGGQQYPSQSFDTTGQLAPPGMKPRVTATLWEDEGSLCFQVEANGVCVARREDNHMINGTKLLNVAGMTRGRRDGILKSEKTRHVVKIGPMHLKGVWIPFDRALDFANKEKITEQLYPLFVHNIGALLYHPQNTGRQSISGATAIAAADRRRQDGSHPDYMRTPQHHNLANPNGSHLPQPPLSAGGRPSLDRAQTFPTPPTSASSMMGINHSGSYEWGAPAPSAVQGGQPNGLSIDTSMNARSVPQTPATTPPGTSVAQMPAYQTTQPYDASRQMYTAPSQQGGYGNQSGMPRYGQLQPSPYVKTEMAPPARGGAEESNGDHKPQDGYGSQSHADNSESEHEGEYTHSAGPYSGNRVSYGYGAHPTPSAMHGDQSHMSSELAGSPHHKSSGGATPRTTASYNAYNTPQRTQLPSSNLYSVMSDNRNAANGADMYGSHNPYSGSYPNGLPPPNKRVRDLDETDDAYSNGSEDHSGLKRRRTVREDSVGRAQPVLATKKR